MKKIILEKERFINILFWILLYFVFWFQAMPQTESLIESFLFPLVLVVLVYPIAGYLSGKLLLKAMRKNHYKSFFFQFIGLSFLTSIAQFLCISLFVFLEKTGIFPPSEYFNWDSVGSIILVLTSSGIFLNLIFCGLRFLVEYSKLQKVMAEYELQTLQQQITPHFMFNVLNHIHVLMQTDVPLASSLLLDYSEILRYQLYNGEKKKVKLEQDIQFLKNFISVEEARWYDKLTVKCQWTIEDGKKDITPLLFIPFVENAFKHVSKSNIEKGFIHLAFEQKMNWVRLEIENSKSTLPNVKSKNSGIGLKNIRERLDILYQDQYRLEIKDEGTSFRIRLCIQL